MFLEFVHDFKDSYLLVKPVSVEAFDFVLKKAVLVDEEGNMLYEEHGIVQMKVVSKFPFH